MNTTKRLAVTLILFVIGIFLFDLELRADGEPTNASTPPSQPEVQVGNPNPGQAPPAPIVLPPSGSESGQTPQEASTFLMGNPITQPAANQEGRTQANVQQGNVAVAGKPDIRGILDGEGKSWWDIDVDNDGAPDFYLRDRDSDGVPDTEPAPGTGVTTEDTNGDGQPDRWIWTTPSGVVIQAIDTDGDGRADWFDYDLDGDGVYDDHIELDDLKRPKPNPFQPKPATDTTDLLI